jgi:hypothetical protein
VAPSGATSFFLERETMEEFLIMAGLSGAASAIITPIADYGFNQNWNFFIVWIVLFFVFYLGEYILD